jgi:hypothetical protein
MISYELSLSRYGELGFSYDRASAKLGRAPKEVDERLAGDPEKEGPYTGAESSYTSDAREAAGAFRASTFWTNLFLAALSLAALAS